MPSGETVSQNISLKFEHTGWQRVVDPVVGQHIRELRERSGTDLSGAARALGVRVKKLRAVEEGEESADSALLHALGGLFSVPVGYFFEGLPPAGVNQADSNPPGKNPTPPRAREIGRLLKTYGNLPNEKLRKSLIQLVEAL
ncbi:MAG: hypothetical protein QGH73_05575 [Rhodospirillales bacterium]|jgi:transcriptional regulator with XRE-family HTH domain|nr:hypothetical protein [Rhodospirillaceae bacterium]MDP6428835.1 hypothetical protein [Rhodospirillales bacterium]MDP6643974.1 hypothetical protein [Rhodospirillales bacterium]MDP6841127.1 hypothetical protein [Rhodospirillales bacterium]|tara:strand:- start:955 stop:1380 length:426 start_codon:yes stop_codon:yes gene_type:complete